MDKDLNKNEEVRCALAINEFYKSLLNGAIEDDEMYPLVYDSASLFDSVSLYSENCSSVYFCGMTFHSELLKLKFWCHTYAERKSEFYIHSMKVNGNDMMPHRYLGSICDCGEYFEICISRTEDLEIEDISTIELIIEVNEEEYETMYTSELHIKCNPSLGLFMVGLI